jgi:hypothetical protein
MKGTLNIEPPCDECGQLKNAFVEAVREVMVLNQLHLTAVVNNDPDPHRFDILIHEANEQKQNAKYAYILHLEGHNYSEKPCNLQTLNEKELQTVC